MATHPICEDLGATDDRGSRGGHLRSKKRHNPFFANESRQEVDRDAQMALDLSRRAASEDVHIDLLGS